MNKINKVNKVDKVLYRLYLNSKELYKDSKRLYIILENTFKLSYKDFYKEVFFLILG